MTKKICKLPVCAKYQAGIITASEGTGNILDSKAMRKNIFT
jgi:hypothetical protein